MVLIPIVSLDMAKTYLRVDSADEDAMIGILLSSAEQMVMDVARLGHAEWKEIQNDDADGNRQLRELLKVAILYAVGYLYEHRENADHHDLVLTLRNLLFAVREGVI